MAQDVDDVLKVNHNPTSEEEKELFKENQKFMCSIFERTLQTDQGKVLVWQYESTYNSQAIYEYLSEYCEEHAKAALDSSSLLACITTARIDE